MRSWKGETGDLKPEKWAVLGRQFGDLEGDATSAPIYVAYTSKRETRGLKVMQFLAISFRFVDAGDAPS